MLSEDPIFMDKEFQDHVRDLIIKHYKPRKLTEKEQEEVDKEIDSYIGLNPANPNKK